jgi:hypothetical protein
MPSFIESKEAKNVIPSIAELEEEVLKETVIFLYKFLMKRTRRLQIFGPCYKNSPQGSTREYTNSKIIF